MKPYALTYAGTALALCFCGISAHAVDIGVQVSGSTEFTDNANQTRDPDGGSQSDTITRPAINITAAQSTETVQLNADFSAQRRISRQEVFEDNNDVVGSANLVWNALPNRLDIIANHTRTQTNIQAINAAGQDNLQETSNTSVGPLLRFNPRGRDEIQFQYTYGDQRAEITNNDLISHNLTARYVVALSPITNLTFEATKAETQFENPVAPDLDIREARIIWAATGRNLNLSVNGGFNDTRRDELDDVDGAVFDINAEWTPFTNNNLRLNVARDIQDQSNNFGNGGFVEDVLTPNNSNINSVVTNQRASLDYSRPIGRRTNLNLNLLWNDDDFEDEAVQLDQESRAISLSISNELTRSTQLRLDLAYTQDTFSDQDDEIDGFSAGIRLDWAATRRLNINAGVNYRERSSDLGDQDVGQLREFDELSAIIGIRYTVLDPALPR